MNKISREDLSWKILSLALAMILWLFVINTQNPTQPQTIKNVPVTIKGLDALEAQGYVLKNEDEIKNQAFAVTIRGPRLEIDKVYNNNLITATLNLNQYLGDLNQDSIQCLANYTIDIMLDGHSITVTDKKPQFTSIVLEREASVTRNVEYQIVDGSTNGYELLGDPVLSPTTIEIKGAKSAINDIASVVVNIDGSTFSDEKLVQRLPVTIYDDEGNEITGLVTSPQNIEVRLLIGKLKNVPLKVSVTGSAQEGYVYVGNKCEPQIVTIVGKAEIVDNINEISLEPIDISEITQTTVIPAKLELPDGVTTSNAKEVNVTIEIDKENTYIYNIPVSMLNVEVTGLSSSLSYEILTSEIQVGISATAEEILSYNAAQIAAELKTTLDLSGYSEGDYTLPLKVQTTAKFKVLNDTIDLEVKLVSLSNVEEETPPPSEEETPTPSEEETPTPSEDNTTATPTEQTQE
nr:CdaR family protein [uncultured Cellulosilyticum sp.]